jgi:hypothetical protein
MKSHETGEVIVRNFIKTCASQQSQHIQFNRLQVVNRRSLIADLHGIAGQCVAVVSCDGYADDLYARQLKVRSRLPAEVAAEKVDEGTIINVPIVR